jgi:glycosyltransferase involved in cell wall biosynthesis
MKTFLIDARNTTKPYNFCLLSALKKKKFPFVFLGYIPGDWAGKSPVKENNLFLPVSRGIFENRKVQRFLANFTQSPEIFFGHARLRGKLDSKTLLHFLWFTVPSIEQYIIPRLPDSRILHTAHNLLPHREYPRDFRKFKKIYSQMDKILVHDNETKNNFYKLFDIPVPVITIPHGNVEIFYNAFDTTNSLESKNFYSRMFSSPKKPIFLFMGPIKKYKRFDTLLSAIHILNKKGLDFSVIVKDKVAQKIKNLYYLMVSPSYSKIGLIYRNVDAVILPHSKISQSVTLFEAGYFKKTVIVADTGGLKETVRDGKDGFIFGKGNPGALAEKMENLIETTSRQIETMGENFKAHLIKEYSWDMISEKLIKIYEKLLNP